MSWSPANAGRLFECESCPPLFGGGVQCIGTRTVDVTQLNEEGWTDLAAGVYVIRYCGGAFDYGLYDGSPATYATTRVPENANPGLGWTGMVVLGYFIAINVNGTYTTFDEGLPSGAGYATHAAAVAGMTCAEYVVSINGGYIKIHFSDRDYTDNEIDPGKTAPTFALYKVTPTIVFDSVSSCHWNSATQQHGFYYFRSDTASGPIDIPVRLTAVNGGGATPAAPVTCDVVLAPTAIASWSWDVTAGNITADLQINAGVVGDDDVFGTMTITMDPVVSASWYDDPIFPDVGTKRRVQINISNTGNGPTNALTVTCTPRNGTQFWTAADQSIEETTPYVLQPTGPGGAWAGVINGGPADATPYLFQLWCSPGGNGRVQFTMSFADGALSWPDFDVDVLW